MLLMNKNLIELPCCNIDIPKISIDQFKLLRLLGKIILENDVLNNGKYSIDLSEKNYFDKKVFCDTVRENLVFFIQNKDANGNLIEEYEFSTLFNDVVIVSNCLYFRTCDLLINIVKNQKCLSSKLRHLYNILFHGIRNKQSLLFLDFLVLKTPKKYIQTITLNLDELKNILDLNYAYKKRNYDFKRLVLDRLVLDITSKTNLHIIIREITTPIFNANSKKHKISSFEISFNLR